MKWQIILAAAVTSSISSFTFAQSPGRGGERPIEQFKQVLEQLELSQDQKVKIGKIVRDKMPDLRQAEEESRSMDATGRRVLLQEQMESIRSAIKAELTDDQQKLFDEKVDQIRTDRQARARDQAGATSRPANAAPGAPAARDRVLQAGQRLSDALEKLDLTDEQKSLVAPVVEKVKSDSATLRAEAVNIDPEVVREQARTIQQEARDSLSQILSPEQQVELRELLRPQRPGDAGGPRNNAAGAGKTREGDRAPNNGATGNAAPDGPRQNAGGPSRDNNAGERRRQRRGNADAPAEAPEKSPEPSMSNQTTMGEAPMEGSKQDQAMDTATPKAAQKSAGSARPAPTAVDQPAPTATVGQALPPFTLSRLDGRPVTRELLVGKPAVIIFGSYSSPNFRDKLPRLQNLYETYGKKANFLIVYTREAHPAGQWDVQRNIEQGIAVEASTSLEQRMTAARVLRDTLKTSMDVVADDFDDKFTTALAGFPNAAIVVDAKGQIVARQQWAEPFGIEASLRGVLREP